MTSGIRTLSVVLVLAAVAAGCSGGGSKETAVDESRLAGRVGDWTVTKDYVYDYIAKLPEAQRRKWDNEAGRAELTDRLIAQELYHREALDHGLDEREDVRKRIAEATRQILIDAYYRNFVEKAAEPTEDEIHDYYESHIDEFTSLPVARAQHIFSRDPKKLEELKERIVEGGEKFSKLAMRYSEDPLTQKDGGDLGYFNPGGYIRGIGFEDALSDTMFKMEVGRVYGPIHWSRGWSLIRVNEKQDATVRPYAEVRDDIVKRLVQDRIDDARRKVYAELKKKYPVRNYLREYYESIQRSPEELFNLAQNAARPQDKIRAYQEIVDKFPQDEWAPKAMFMIGFVYAEELGDYTMADKTFAHLLEQYPNSELADQARYMIDNMGKGLPKFEDMEKQVRESQ